VEVATKLRERLKAAVPMPTGTITSNPISAAPCSQERHPANAPVVVLASALQQADEHLMMLIWSCVHRSQRSGLGVPGGCCVH
jgi:hypothetical protein